MDSIPHKILVLSGKGGVGKSLVAAQLAYFLASRKVNVGLLDIDICGPSIPRLLGAIGESIHPSSIGWEPVYVKDNLAVISSGFLLEKEDDPIIWRGPKKNGLISQFLKDVDWCDVDYLVIDSPPGTSDEHLSICQMLSESQIDGAVIVTTPQEVSLLDVRKEIDFCRKIGINILGVVENMSSFVCSCGQKVDIFPKLTGGAQKMCEDLNVKYFGSIPLDPILAKLSDEGKEFNADRSILKHAGPSAMEKVMDKIVNTAEGSN